MAWTLNSDDRKLPRRPGESHAPAAAAEISTTGLWRGDAPLANAAAREAARADSESLRYVVLFHRWPAATADGFTAARGDHYDWMFESPEGLLTWATERRLSADEAGVLEAIELPLHRTAYLDYEGPVSRNRGEVRRVESGRFCLITRTVDRFEVDLRGGREGRLRITRGHLVDDLSWRLEFRIQPVADSNVADARW